MFVRNSRECIMILNFGRTLVITLIFANHLLWAQETVNTCRPKADAPPKPPAPCSNELFKKSFEQIKIQAVRNDVTKAIKDFLKSIHACKLSNEKLGYPAKELSTLVRTSQRNEYTDIVRRLSASASTKILTRAEKQELLAAGKKIAVPEPTLNGFLKALDQRGKTAESRCKPEDLRSKLPPIRNQDSLGWCVSYVIADLVGYKYGKHLSAVDVSLSNIHETSYKEPPYWKKLLGSYFSYFREPKLIPEQNSEASSSKSKDIKNVFADAKARGFCYEADVPSTDFKYSTEVHNFYVAFKELEVLQCELNKNQKIDMPCFKCEKNNFADKIFPRLNNQQFVNILKSSSKNEILKSLADASCKNRFFMPKSAELEHVHLTTIRDKILGLEKINEQLLNKNIVGILYHSTILRNPEAPFDGKHASSLVGRRWNAKTKSCEFLLRNSWGKTCNYNPAYTCEPGGYLWIPQGDLIHGTFGFEYIKN